MPNLNPVPDSVENLRVQRRLIEETACIHIYPYGAITVGELLAGSVITEPVPADALGLGRARQVNIEGWAADYRRRLHEDDEA